MSDNEVLLDEDAKQLKLLLIKEETRKAIAEARKATQEADLAAATAAITDAQSKLVTGPVELGEKGGASLASVVAAAQLDDVARAIADVIKTKVPGGRVLVVDERVVSAGDAVYLAVVGRIEQFHRDLATLEQAVRLEVTPTAPPADRAPELATIAAAALLPALPALAGLAVNALGLLKQTITVAPRDLPLDSFALITEIGCHLQGEVTIVLPDLALIEQSTVFQRLNEAAALRLKLEQQIALSEHIRLQPKIRRLETLVAELAELRSLFVKAVAEKQDANSPQIKAVIDERQQELATFDADTEFLALRANAATARSLIAAFDAFVTSVTTVPSGETATPLVAAALREILHRHEEKLSEDGKPTHLLHVTITASGGDAVTRTGFVGLSQKAAFLAAVQAAYALVSADGAIVASGAVTKFGLADYDFTNLRLRSSMR